MLFRRIYNYFCAPPQKLGMASIQCLEPSPVQRAHHHFDDASVFLRYVPAIVGIVQLLRRRLDLSICGHAVRRYLAALSAAMGVLTLLLAPASAQQPIFLVPGGSVGPPTANTTALGTGLAFNSLPRVYIPTASSLQYNAPYSWSIGIKAPITFGASQSSIFGNNQWGVFGGPTSTEFFSTGSAFTCFNLATACARNSLFVLDNAFHLLNGVDDGTFLYMYVDGGLVDIEVSGTYTPSTLFNLMGEKNTVMTLVDARIWGGRALSAADVALQAALFKIGLVPSTGHQLQTGLVAEWPLGSGTITLPSGTTSGSITDIINGNTGIIDTTPPTVAVTAPSNGAGPLSGNVTVTATASDNTVVTQVQLLVDTNVFATLTIGPFTATWNSATTFDGSHTLQAVATDFAGNTTTSATITVTTSNGIAANTVLHFATAGSNANGPGCLLATPCQTIAYANTLTLYPTWTVAFNGPDTFNGCLLIVPTNVPSGGDISHPIVIGSYGSGTPNLVSNCPGVDNGSNGPKSAAVKVNGVSGGVIQDLSITAPSTGGAGTLTQFGIIVENASGPSTGINTWVIQRNAINGFTSDQPQDTGSDIYLSGFSVEGVCGSINAVQVLNNTLGDPSSTTANGHHGVDGQNCGTGIGHATNITLQGNIMKNHGGNTAFNVGSGWVGSWNIVLGQFNLAHDNGANTNSCGGPVGQWLFGTDSGVIKFAETYNQTPTILTGTGLGCDQSGFGFDGAVTNSTLEYYYSHDNAGGGFYFCGGCSGQAWGPNTVRYGVHENNARMGNTDYFGELAIGHTGGTVGYVYNISIYNSLVFSANNQEAACFGNDSTQMATGSILANIICQIAGHDQNNNAIFWADNHGGVANLILFNFDFYNSGSGNSKWICQGTIYSTLATWATPCTSGVIPTGWITTNPSYTTAGGGGTCTWTPSTQATWPPTGCASAYIISTTSSPVIGTGKDLTVGPYNLNVGNRDYYANTVPSGHGTGYNSGADGGFP